MESIKPREMNVARTGQRTFQIKTVLFDEEFANQETIDKTLNGLADVVMGQLKNQEYIPADAEVTNLQSSQLDDNNVMISIEWDTTLNTSYIICDTLDAVITTAKQMKPIASVFENRNLTVYKNLMTKDYAVGFSLPSDANQLKTLKATLIHLGDYDQIRVQEFVNFAPEYLAEHGELICNDLFMLAEI